MTHKRKSSALEDNLSYPQALTSPLTPSKSSPPSSIRTQTTPNGDSAYSYGLWHFGTVPYLNTRTRKRHRDDRPDDETVHVNTLKILYDAQRLHLDEAMPMSDGMFLDEQEAQAGEDDEMTDDLVPELPLSIQHDQRTIHAFFGGKPSSQDNLPGVEISDNDMNSPSPPSPQSQNQWHANWSHSWRPDNPKGPAEQNSINPPNNGDADPIENDYMSGQNNETCTCEACQSTEPKSCSRFLAQKEKGFAKFGVFGQGCEDFFASLELTA